MNIGKKNPISINSWYWKRGVPVDTATTIKYLFGLTYLSTLYLCSNVSAKEIQQRLVVEIPLTNSIVPYGYEQWPLVGKCCSMNQVLRKEKEESKCESNSGEAFSPYFSDFNYTGVLIPGDERKEFVAVVGDPCRHKKYILDPKADDDEYYLLSNGSIFAPRHEPRMLAPRFDYCMENIPNFGHVVLVCFSKDPGIVTADSRIKYYTGGLLISVPFLLMTIAAYVITPKLGDLHGKALCHYCGCLALAFTTLALTQLTSEYLSDQSCVCVGFVIQFSFVACFFWLNVMCIETWLLVRHHVDRPNDNQRTDQNKMFFYYSIWGWGPPAVLILVSMIMDLNPTVPTTYVKPNFGIESCWFESDQESMPYFYIPVGFVLSSNLVLFAMTSMKIIRYQNELALRSLTRNNHEDHEDQRSFGRLKRTFLVCFFLFFLMGLNWAMELISWYAGADPLDWSAFDLINALQGALVFLLFVVRYPCRQLVWHRLQTLWGIDALEPVVGSMDLMLLPIVKIEP